MGAVSKREISGQGSGSSFGATLYKYRQRTIDPDAPNGRCLTQERVAELLCQGGWCLHSDAKYLSYWERGSRNIKHTDRRLLLGLVHILFEHNGLQTVVEANELLTSGGYSPLTDTEIQGLMAKIPLATDGTHKLQGIEALGEDTSPDLSEREKSSTIYSVHKGQIVQAHKFQQVVFTSASIPVLIGLSLVGLVIILVWLAALLRDAERDSPSVLSLTTEGFVTERGAMADDGWTATNSLTTSLPADSATPEVASAISQTATLELAITPSIPTVNTRDSGLGQGGQVTRQPSQTPSPTSPPPPPSATSTPAPTPSATPTFTPVPTPIPSATPTPLPTPTFTVTPSPTYTPTPLPPAAPANFGAEAVDFNSIRLIWDDVGSDAVEYRLQRGEPPTIIYLGTNQTSYVDQDLEPGTSYCYFLQTFTTWGESDWIQACAETWFSYTDDFSDPSRWNSQTDPSGGYTTGYQGEEYEIAVFGSQVLNIEIWENSWPRVPPGRNYYVAADMYLLGLGPVRYGFVFDKLDPFNFYVFSVNPGRGTGDSGTGNWELKLVVEGEKQVLATGSHSAIRSDNEVNRLRVEVENAIIRAYINDELVGTWPGGVFNGPANTLTMGLLAKAGTSDAVARFDNFRLEEIPPP